MAAADRKRLNKLLKKASSVLGCPADTVEVVGDGKALVPDEPHLPPHA